MGRCAAALAGLAVILGGCSLDPSVGDTLAPIERHGLRITKGLGTSSEYGNEVSAQKGNVVQVLTEIADGNAVEVTMPRGPSEEILVTAEAESGATSTSRLVSATGEPIILSRLFQFDPGYIGVENNSDEERLSLRIATSRLTGAGQGQVPFTFKVNVR